jgi:hypothetical protein
MKKYFFSFALACVLAFSGQGQSIFDNSLVHEVRIASLYDGLLDTLTSEYLFSFNFLQQQIRDIPYTYCKIELDGTALDTIGIRYKGFNSWWSSPKKPMKLDLNRFKKGQNYQGYQKLNLHNRASDPTFQREALCYSLLHDMDVPTPRTAYSKVYLDDNYLGLYRLVEEVDNEFLDVHFGDHAGNLYKQNASGAGGYGLEWMGNQAESYYTHLSLENHRSENDWSALVHFIDVLNNTPDAVFADSIAAIFDVGGFLRVLALDLAINNYDYYGNSGRNYYLYQDVGGDGKFHWLPWDYNLSWSADASLLEPDLALSPVLVRRLLAVPQFLVQFRAQYCVLRQYFATDILMPRMDTTATLIRPALINDPSLDYTVADFEQNLGEDWFNLPGLKPFLAERSAEIDAFLQKNDVDCNVVLDASESPIALGRLLIAPNPSTQFVKIEWRSDFRPQQLFVFDVFGRCVRSEHGWEGNCSGILDLSGLPVGSYFVLMVDSQERQMVGKIWKN